MNGRRSRIARKAARVEKTEIDREFDTDLGKLRTELNEALAAANQAHRDGVKKLDADRVKARSAAWKGYDEDRTKLLKRLAAKERAAA